MDRLKGKVAVVTGAGSGIGLATAKRFAAEGAKVVVADLNGETARGVVAEIESAGGEALALAIDVGSGEQVRSMIDTTISTFGKIDVLHNNAANTNLNDAAKDISLLDFNVDIFHKNMDINVRSEEHTSELQSLMRISYAVFCLKKKTYNTEYISTINYINIQKR